MPIRRVPWRTACSSRWALSALWRSASMGKVLRWGRTCGRERAGQWARGSFPGLPCSPGRPRLPSSSRDSDMSHGEKDGSEEGAPRGDQREASRAMPAFRRTHGDRAKSVSPLECEAVSPGNVSPETGCGADVTWPGTAPGGPRTQDLGHHFRSARPLLWAVWPQVLGACAHHLRT